MFIVSGSVMPYVFCSLSFLFCFLRSLIWFSSCVVISPFDHHNHHHHCQYHHHRYDNYCLHRPGCLSVLLPAPLLSPAPHTGDTLGAHHSRLPFRRPDTASGDALLLFSLPFVLLTTTLPSLLSSLPGRRCGGAGRHAPSFPHRPGRLSPRLPHSCGALLGPKPGPATRVSRPSSRGGAGPRPGVPASPPYHCRCRRWQVDAGSRNAAVF